MEVNNDGWMEKDWKLYTCFHSPVHSVFFQIDDRPEFAVELVVFLHSG